MGNKPPLPPLAIKGFDATTSSMRKAPVFDEGHIPKNKDVNAFTADVQRQTPTQQFISYRRAKAPVKGMRSYLDLPREHSFGHSSSCGR